MKKISFVISISLLACLLIGCEKELNVRKVSPAIGVLSGSEPINILGSGFKNGMGISVYFGNTKVDNVVIRGSETLSISTPSVDTAGPIDIRVVTDDGIEFLMKGAFTYVEKSNMDIRDMGKRRSIRDDK